MSPRALVDSGLRGASRKALTEGAKETARELAFIEGYVRILRYQQTPDGGGDVTKSWVPDAKPIRGRLKSIRHLPHQQPIGGRVNEASTHLVELDPDVQITTKDRLEISEMVFIILSSEPGTDAAFLQLEVKEL